MFVQIIVQIFLNYTFTLFNYDKILIKRFEFYQYLFIKPLKLSSKPTAGKVDKI